MASFSSFWQSLIAGGKKTNGTAASIGMIDMIMSAFLAFASTFFFLSQTQMSTRLHRVRTVVVRLWTFIPLATSAAMAFLLSYLRGDGLYRPTFTFAKCASGVASASSFHVNDNGKDAASPRKGGSPDDEVVLYAWPLSYFSGKVRAFLRYQSNVAGLRWREEMATPEVIGSILLPATASHTVPQVSLPGLPRNGKRNGGAGRGANKKVDSSVIIHDSTEIMDRVARCPSLPCDEVIARHC